MRLRRTLPILIALCGVFLPAPASVASDRENSRPHLVFILADDLGYGDLGSYGCDDIRTPNLDQLAAEGVRFTDCYANASICSPTRAAFLTGRYQQRIGLDDALYYQEQGRGLPPDGTTLADALKTAGYATAMSGKWHVGYGARQRPTSQGFDRFFGLLGGNHHYFEHMDRIGVPDLFLDERAIELDGYSTDLITQYAIDFFRETAPRQPTFLCLSYNAPHFPWQGPGDRDRVVRPKHPSWQQGDRATYRAMVESMDAGIGKLLAEIDRLGLRQRTLVVFTSDNGGDRYSRNAPLAKGKGTLWEGGLRVPCVARWPSVLPEGRDTSQVAITMDWTATFRRAAGLPKDANEEDGIDLLPILAGRQPPVERTLFWRRVNGPIRKNVAEGRAVRGGRWKLIEMADGQRFLFDLDNDIRETRNLIDEHADIAHELSTAADAWEAEVSARP